MDTKKRMLFIAIMLILATGNYFRIIDNGSIRAVEFLSIFAIGALSGVLLREVFIMIKNK